MHLDFPCLDGLNWSKIRAIGRDLAATSPAEDVIAAAVPELANPDHRRRMLAAHLLGFTATERLLSALGGKRASRHSASARWSCRRRNSHLGSRRQPRRV